jgi:hypothetical protein
MRPASTQRRNRSVLWDFLTFERMMTGPVIHLIYWAGLGMIAIIGFGFVGTGVGLGLRDDGISGWLLGVAVAVAGLLMVGAFAMIWRGMCEFFVAIFRISDDLRALRKSDEVKLAEMAKADKADQAKPEL